MADIRNPHRASSHLDSRLARSGAASRPINTVDAHVGLLTTLYITCKDFIGYLTLPVPLTLPVLLFLRGSLGIFTIFCGWLVWAPVGFCVPWVEQEEGRAASVGNTST